MTHQTGILLWICRWWVPVVILPNDHRHPDHKGSPVLRTSKNPLGSYLYDLLDLTIIVRGVTVELLDCRHDQLAFATLASGHEPQMQGPVMLPFG